MNDYLAGLIILSGFDPFFDSKIKPEKRHATPTLTSSQQLNRKIVTKLNSQNIHPLDLLMHHPKEFFALGNAIFERSSLDQKTIEILKDQGFLDRNGAIKKLVAEDFNNLYKPMSKL